MRYIHGQNLMIRDVSPDNVLVFEDGKVIKLCDFGLVSYGDKSKLDAGKIYYKAPEIIASNL